MSDNWITDPSRIDTSSVSVSSAIVWFDWMVWSATRPDFVTEPYCYHRAKHSCEGGIDWMQVKVINGRKHHRALCRKHYEQLRDKGVQHVG